VLVAGGVTTAVILATRPPPLEYTPVDVNWLGAVTEMRRTP
jgi:hypothetical protein